MSNYNGIAKYYDVLAKLVFGNSQVNAQKQQLVYICENDKILIVGGGTGWILEEITEKFRDGLVIDYVESSNRMIEISKKRFIGRNLVNYHHFSVENLVEVEKYDVVISAFLFDNFLENDALNNFVIIHRSLKMEGLWLFTDFHLDQNRSVNWRNMLVKAMYLFFRLVADVKPRDIPDMKPLFQQYGYRIISLKSYYRNLIHAVVYKKDMN
ncbi:ubiquinone/menaquinone biosynthesis C-methylase UbiE [Pedobacter sp. UYEF25]